MNTFTKTMFVLALLTVGFAGVATYAGGKALDQDPQLISKLESKYNVRIRIGGMAKNFSVQPAGHKITEDSWTFAPPVKKVLFRSVSGSFSVKKSQGKEIVIKATGNLDTNIAPRLLKTETSNSELTVSEPDNEAVEKLQVQVEIPETFTGSLKFQTVSGDMSLENLKIQDLEFMSVSGQMNINQVIADELDFKTVSGGIITQNSEIKKFEGKTVSGDIAITNSSPIEAELKTVSGDVKIKIPDENKTKFYLKTISGNIKNSLSSQAKGEFEIQVNTTSGDISIE